MSPASFPPAVSWPGAPFPPRGPSGRFPRFTGTMRRSDSLPPVPPRFVAFAWRYPGCTRVSLPRPPSAPPRAWSWSPGSSGRDLPRRRQDLPGSWGTPVNVPCSPTPAGPRTPGHCGAATRPSVTSTTSAPASSHFGAQSHGPLTRCLRFAARVTPAPRKTRFRPLARLYRTGLVTRRVPTKGFRVTSLPPFPSFPGARSCPARRAGRCAAAPPRPSAPPSW